MALALPRGGGWVLSVVPVGAVATLFARLLALARGGAVALGVDFPLGLPREYARLHGAGRRISRSSCGGWRGGRGFSRWRRRWTRWVPGVRSIRGAGFGA